MFEVTPDDIQQLNDTDLCELAALLCEAELAAQGLSTVAVTWGGSQTAADGGLDVRVHLAAQSFVEGYIPRPASDFQVKKPDMPRAEILEEGDAPKRSNPTGDAGACRPGWRLCNSEFARFNV